MVHLSKGHALGPAMPKHLVHGGNRGGFLVEFPYIKKNHFEPWQFCEFRDLFGMVKAVTVTLF